MAESSSIPSIRPAHVVGTTLREHVLQDMHAAPGATGEFTSLLNHISLAIRIINSRVRAAGLAGLLGYTGETNVQGEAVQKLDAFSNEVLLNVLDRSGHCGLIGSEELDDAQINNNHAKYVVLFDPLDGSSNIDTNVGIGTIFAVLRRSEPKLTRPNLADALRPGREIVAAGYVLYGPSTVFVLSTGQGTHGFTLDPAIGEFFLSHPDIRVPARGSCFSVNEGNFSRWSPEIQNWARWIKGEDSTVIVPSEGAEPLKTPYGARYVGSLVADAHRTLIKGGIFAYPADSKSKNGKLRLLYEANPMAFLFEQAGGMATNGKDRILEIMPTELHQRVPLVLGSRDDVSVFRQFVTGERVK
ncbi:class 1 fructose-bisphosphatase [Labilithrix luteola]|nr:class 1 fructose-bisphosphatase [Labilithrix luteola]